MNSQIEMALENWAEAEAVKIAKQRVKSLRHRAARRLARLADPAIIELPVSVETEVSHD